MSRYLTDHAGLQALLHLLTPDYQLSEEHHREQQLRYLDSFDWRVWRSGGVLVVEEEGGYRNLIWRSVNDGEVFQRIPLETMPVLVSDIPAWIRPEPLQQITKMRALLELAQSRARISEYEILDKRGKVVLRLQLVHETIVYRNHRKGNTLPAQLRLLGVKGFECDLEKVRALVWQLEMPAYGKDPLARLLSLLGRRPCDYTSKLRIELQPLARADVVSKHILLQLLDIMQANENGICEDVDTEFLHDFRVSVRRSRSLLSHAKGIFPKDTIRRFAKDLAWLGDITTPHRDLDVWLLAFDSYQQALPKKLQADLLPLRSWLEEARQTAHRSVVEVLQGPLYRRFCKGWRVFLQCETPQHTVLKYADSPVIDVAGGQIWKTYRQLREVGDAITPDSPPERLHKLRKIGKKLRYLLEFFRTLYAGTSVNQLIEQMQSLQDYLGLYQDYTVQRLSLQQFMQDMQDAGRLDVRTEQAMNYLIKDLRKRQGRHRRAFDENYQHFNAGKSGKLFRQLFRPCGKSS